MNERSHQKFIVLPDRVDGVTAEVIRAVHKEKPRGSLTWPADKDTVMNVTGFADALRSAVMVQIAVEFDLDVAGARLLGADAARLASMEATENIRRLLDSEAEIERLMQQGISSEEGRFAALLLNFRKGFLSKTP